ncbi:MAG: sigma-70 family RNA polymerase sigma factor, partial [Flavobacteriaceae bacterium]|nr:sigma-70 family RNA polymerase sigma factor [Flavobacteriaceae bacterium]
WVERYADFLFNYTITRVNDAVLAEDLIQETFIAGIKSMKNFKGEAAERTWLVSILKRKIIDHYRFSNSKKGKAEVKMSYLNPSEDDGDWMEERVSDQRHDNIEDQIENEELGDAINSCIAQLPEKYALIFKEKTIQNMDTETICKAHDITASNLWVIIHRARTQLKDCLKKNWF